MPQHLKTLGFTSNPEQAADYARDLDRIVYFNLVAQGLMDPADCPDPLTADLATSQRDRLTQAQRLLEGHHCPIDQRIESFLKTHLADVADPDKVGLPNAAISLDRHGIARRLSLPAKEDRFVNAYVDSTRVANGVLHNPRNDRRTTKGTFHVADGGLPVPPGKKTVPKAVFAKMLELALQPPDDLTHLPFTSGLNKPGHAWVSLMLRPLVWPEIPGVCQGKSMEVRFFAPGALVSNLDFVESIFGNGGNPHLPENDAALDTAGWTGHTGCVILAPHLDSVRKIDLGLPHISEATDLQKQDGMCWENEEEIYNDGGAYKCTCRTEDGVIITLIADNYFGYCKKEVKTQISYAANLMGWCEEEHAGGTVAYPTYNLGTEFKANSRQYNERSFEDIARDYGDLIDVKPEGYGVDKKYSEIVYIPEDASAKVEDLTITWQRGVQTHSIPLEPGKHYITPSGYRFRMAKHPAAPTWRLIGTLGEGAVCHKPCTVSGGGKSEISKPLRDYMLYGPVFVSDIDVDLDLCEQIIAKDYSARWKPELLPKQQYGIHPSRPILSEKRSLGSVIKLLTPNPDFTDEYNDWLTSIPSYVLPIVFVIKRLYEAEWGDDWRSHFTVDTVNGFPGHELKMDNRQVVGSYLRVGFDEQGAWRTFKLRQDFMPSEKISIEDDITASVVLPADRLNGLNPNFNAKAYKFVQNCEYRFFQRPDEAIHRGFDHGTERDLAQTTNFLCNYEPLNDQDAKDLVSHVVEFDQYTQPMQDLISGAAAKDSGYVVSSAHPRLVNGIPTKNPRYLQPRPDLEQPIKPYLTAMGTRLFRGLRPDQSPLMPVNAVLTGRRNNPSDAAAGIRGLAVYNPMHYQQLPELFMEFICSLTGKSPSTTGAGTEGALTKRPFNALNPTADLNNAFVSFIVTNLAGYSTSAGYVGPKFRFDHDISLLIPEIAARMSPHEIDPDFLIKEGLLEKIDDFDFEGEKILASRLGYRINEKFIGRFFGRIFDNPMRVFTPDMLRPEKQSLADFADGVKNITEAQTKVALEYFKDGKPGNGGAVDEACPPLQAVLHIMAFGEYNGLTADSPELRQMFDPETVMASDCYQQRLTHQQSRDIAASQRSVDHLKAYIADPSREQEVERLGLKDRLALAIEQLEVASSAEYVQSLTGALGADPIGAYQ